MSKYFKQLYFVLFDFQIILFYYNIIFKLESTAANLNNIRHAVNIKATQINIHNKLLYAWLRLKLKNMSTKKKKHNERDHGLSKTPTIR